MDAWWPRLLEAEFRPMMGTTLFTQSLRRLSSTTRPTTTATTSARPTSGWYGYAQKDLRAVLGRRVRGRFARVFCGAGRLSRCRAALVSSLRAALAVPRASLYQDATCAAQGKQGDQYCYDEVSFRPLGALTQPLIPWINRPTYQQADEIQ